MGESETKKIKKPASDAAYYRFAMRVVGDFGVSIAVPVVIATFVGIWLDREFGTTPWLLFAGLAASLLATYLVIKKKAIDYAKRFEALGKEKEEV